MRDLDTRTFSVLLAVVAAVSLGLSLSGNGSGRPLDEHEVFVARTTTEMSRRGDWLVPYFGGQLRLQKLPLNYWLTALACKVTGVDPREAVPPFAARLPSAVAAVLLVFLTAALTWEVARNRSAVLLAAAAVATSNGVIAWSHSARPEMVYATLCSACLYCFVRAARTLEGGSEADRTGVHPGWVLAGWAFAALATLAKGPHYPLFIVVAVFLAAYYRWRDLRAAIRLVRPVAGLVLATGLVMTYVVPLALHVPGLFAFWRREMFYRTGGAEGFLHLFKFYYVWALVQLSAPWFLVVLPGVVWAARRLRSMSPAATPCWFALVVPAVILSCSRGQRAYYLLPSLAPAIALGTYAFFEVLRSGYWLMGRPLPVDRVIRAHVLIAAIITVVVCYRLWEFGQIGLVSWAESVGVVAAIGTAVVLLVLAGRLSRTARGIATASLLAALVLVYAAGATAGLLWSPDRYLVAERLRATAAKLPRDVPLYTLAGRFEHLIYYGDRPVHRLTHAEARQLVNSGTDGLLLLDTGCPRCQALAAELPTLFSVDTSEERLLVARVSRAAHAVSENVVSRGPDRSAVTR